MKLRHLITSALALILMSACTDGLVDVNVDEIVGTWNATSMVFTSDADSEVSVDLIAEGATLSVVLSAEGTYSLLIQEPGFEPEDEGGTYSVDGAILTLDPNEFEEDDSFETVLNGNSLTLTSSDDEFDFNDDEIEEAASLEVRMSRVLDA